MIERIIEERCNGCGWCPLSCRMDLIAMDRRQRKAYFAHPEQCVVCYFCVRTCPLEAIVVGPEKPAPFPRPLELPQLQGELNILAARQPLRQETADVVVLGSGVAGLSAAISAACAGASVVILDKASGIRWTNTSLGGGSTSFAKEREMYPDAPRLSAEDKVRQAMELTGGQARPDLIRTYRERVDEAIRFLRRLGVKEGLQGIVPSVVAFSPRGMGAGLNKQLLSIVRRLGCHVHFNSRAVGLLQGPGGAVTGVRAITLEGAVDWLARAVILATAGFQANREMVRQYIGPQFEWNTRLTGSPFATGDGHRLAQEVGAKLVNMSAFHCRQLDSSWVPFSTGSIGPRQLQPYQHYGIFVNKLGKRFIDEYGPTVRSDTVSCSVAAQPDGEVAYIWDEPIRTRMRKKFDDYLPQHIIQQASTLQEIARKMGCPPQALLQTVQEYNKAVVEGRAKSLDVPKSDFTFALEHPPFYFIYPVWAGHNATFGGPLVNARAEVLGEQERPIPGLLAVGEVAGGFFYGEYKTTSGGAIYYQGNYQVTSSSVGYCETFGRIAGLTAAARAPGKE